MSKTTSIFLLLTLQIIIKTSEIESKPIPGQKMALGAGLLAGGLAGAAVTSILTQNSSTDQHYHHSFHNESSSINASSPVPSQVPATTVVRVQTFSNGCYKQVVREADITDIRKFIETEQLICPSGIRPSSVTVLSDQSQQPSITPVQTMNLAPMVSGSAIVSSLPPTQYYAAPPYAPDIEFSNIAPINGTHIAHPPVFSAQKNEHPLNATAIPFINYIPALNYQPMESVFQPNISNRPVAPSYAAGPVYTAPIAVLPQPSVPAASGPAIITQHKNEPSVMNPPVLSEIPNSQQVMIISKKVGYYEHEKKKNTANTLNNSYCVVYFVLITIISNYI